jgi:hypothetical protein
MAQRDVMEQLLFFQHSEIEVRENFDKTGEFKSEFRVFSRKKDGQVGIHLGKMGNNIETNNPVSLKFSTMFLVHKIRAALEVVKDMGDEPMSFYFSEFVQSNKGEYLVSIRSVLTDDSQVCTRIHKIESKGSEVNDNGLICTEYSYNEVDEFIDMIN